MSRLTGGARRALLLGIIFWAGCAAASTAPAAHQPSGASSQADLLRIVDLQYGGSYCALRSDGRVACWGMNIGGSLGDGTNEARSRPALLPGLTDVRRLIGFPEGGDGKSQGFCAVRADGSLWCWGFSGTRAPAQGTTPRRLAGAVVDVAGVVHRDGYGVCAREAGGATSCFELRAEQSGPCPQWADGAHSSCLYPPTTVTAVPRAPNQPGQLPWNEPPHRDKPICEVSGGRVSCHTAVFPHISGRTGTEGTSFWVPGLDQVSSVAAGSRSACAVRAGQAFCWGDNHLGEIPVMPDPQPCHQFGGTLPCNREPTLVPLPDVREILLDAFPRTLAIDRSGALFLGCTVNEDRPSCTPLLQRLEGFPPVAKLVPATGAYSQALCALTTAGEVHCLGYGPDAGDGAVVVSRTPVQIRGIDDAVEVALASDELCARRRDGSIICWGDRFAPRRLPPVTSVASPCALAADGKVWCWGENGDGQMGLGVRNSLGRERDAAKGLRVPGLERITALSSSTLGTTCALSASGEVFCWGGLDYPSLRPTRISGLPPAQQIWSGRGLACALSRQGRVYCWQGSDKLVERKDLGTAALLPSAGRGPSHAEQLCVVTPERRLRCGRLPAAVPDIGDVRQLSLAVHHGSGIPIGCAVVGGGALRCWGPPHCSEYADVCVSRPWNQVETVLTEVRGVALDDRRACAVRIDGTVWCWGGAQHGTFGGRYTQPLDRVTHPDLSRAR
jgi:alpha-tubulin suppressor-like RCC1 family protein